MMQLNADWRSLPRSDRLELAQYIDESARRYDLNRLKWYQPYAKQREFHENGATARERLLMAGNQLGKTYCGAAEMAMHLTGRYPEWWRGRVFDAPIRAWAGSVTSEVTRDNCQRTLIGEPRDAGRWGEGAIPADALGRITRKVGVPDSIDGVLVRHESGGWSSLGFKSYDQGRTKWQGDTLQVVWFDEEPPMDLYIEGLTRTNATGGMVYLTFTPLLGMSEVVHGFLEAE